MEKIKQYSYKFADAAHEIDFVFNMAPNQSGGGAYSAPPGVDEYSDHHDQDILSSNDMGGVIAAFSSRQYVPNVAWGPHKIASFKKDLEAFTKAFFKKSKDSDVNLVKEFIDRMRSYGITITVN